MIDLPFDADATKLKLEWWLYHAWEGRDPREELRKITGEWRSL